MTKTHRRAVQAGRSFYHSFRRAAICPASTSRAQRRRAPHCAHSPRRSKSMRDSRKPAGSTGAAGGAEDFEAGLWIRVAGGQISDEDFSVFGGEFGEGGGDSIHITSPEKKVCRRGHRDSQRKKALWNSVFSVVQTADRKFSTVWKNVS